MTNFQAEVNQSKAPAMGAVSQAQKSSGNVKDSTTLFQVVCIQSKAPVMEAESQAQIPPGRVRNPVMRFQAVCIHSKAPVMGVVSQSVMAHHVVTKIDFNVTRIDENDDAIERKIEDIFANVDWTVSRIRPTNFQKKRWGF